MNPQASSPSITKGCSIDTIRGHLRQYASFWAWATVLIIVNGSLAWGEIRSSLLYLPGAVEAGQWWRFVTYPLVHLSWYHLLLDAGGFLLLYGCLEEKRWLPRALYVIGASAGSLMLASALDPALAQRGLAGLSGIAHGLMAVAAIEMLRHKEQRTWGWISLVTVVAKSAYELWSGQVLFEFIHMGLCGQPLAASHAGGVVGALISYGLVHTRPVSQPHLHRGRARRNSRISAPRPAVQIMLFLAVRLLTRVMYRVRYKGLERIPSQGAAVLVCNHVSYVDWLIIASACRRPVHFVMHADIYRMPVLGWIFRMARVIPIESGRKNPAALRRAFNEIARVLQNDGLVCIFPEGHLTRNGCIGNFRPGIERIIRQQPAPVIPLALRGLWGSFFSHKDGPAMRHRPKKIWPAIELTIGHRVRPWRVTAHSLRLTVQQLHGGGA